MLLLCCCRAGAVSCVNRDGILPCFRSSFVRSHSRSRSAVCPLNFGITYLANSSWEYLMCLMGIHS